MSQIALLNDIFADFFESLGGVEQLKLINSIGCHSVLVASLAQILKLSRAGLHHLREASSYLVATVVRVLPQNETPALQTNTGGLGYLGRAFEAVQ